MIEFIEAYHIHLFSSLLLLIIVILNRFKKDIPTFSINIFYGLILVNLFLLILEPLSFIADSNTHNLLPYLNYAIDFLVVLLTPVLVGLWSSYIDYKLFKKRNRLRKRLYYQHVAIISFVGLLINFFTPVFFSIDLDTNTYQRGYLFFLRYAMIFALYIHITYMTIKNKNRQNSQIIIGILIFLLFPIIGSIIQLFYQTLYFQFSGAALGVLVVFIFLETTSGNKDYLTNLYSRRVLDEYLNILVEKKEQFTVMMIDLDHFKMINDELGHQAGDQVLIEFSRILSRLKKSKKTLITRLGGDEFLCILTEDDHTDAKKYIEKLYKETSESVILKENKFKGFSEGILPYDHKMGIDKLLRNVDARMYDKKYSKR
ncbi:MAG: GGDEF domain-containing protein [Acholeplasmataceae bacterium]|nr:GGDEF domain-containing protein [Acholeplasmataceae bacterium]